MSDSEEYSRAYRAGVLDERQRTRDYVIPAVLNFYKLADALEQDPNLATRLMLTYPDEVQRLMSFLNTPTHTEEQADARN